MQMLLGLFTFISISVLGICIGEFRVSFIFLSPFIYTFSSELEIVKPMLVNSSEGKTNGT